MSARLVARSCAAGGALGLVLMGGPAWALDLPSLPPAPASAEPSLPVPVPTALLPQPIASAAAPVLSQLPGNEPSPTPAKPSPRPAPKPKPAPPSDLQAARAETGIAAIPATSAFTAGTGTAALRALPGISTPMTVQPQPVVPQLTPAATAAAARELPASTPTQGGLPAVVVALAIVTVSAVAAGQVAEMAERRRA